MILDKENAMSYKQAITTSAVSQNVIDLGPPHWMYAAGNDSEIPVALAVDAPFVGAGASLEVKLESSPVEAFGSGVIVHYARTFPVASLNQVGRMPQSISLPPDVQQYVRGNYVVTTGPFTQGKITLSVTASRQTNG